eukprot:546263-Rhodomonas_salina.10
MCKAPCGSAGHCLAHAHVSTGRCLGHACASTGHSRGHAHVSRNSYRTQSSSAVPRIAKRMRRAVALDGADKLLPSLLHGCVQRSIAKYKHPDWERQDVLFRCSLCTAGRSIA